MSAQYLDTVEEYIPFYTVFEDEGTEHQTKVGWSCRRA
jgi:hypothetical protein